MKEEVEIKKIENSKKLEAFLVEVDNYFPVPLSKKVVISDYVMKTLKYGINISAEINNKIVAVALGYGNDVENKIGYLSTIVVHNDYQGKKIAQKLIEELKKECIKNKMIAIKLYVYKDNIKAINLYSKLGFKKIEEQSNYDYNITMEWRSE